MKSEKELDLTVETTSLNIHSSNIPNTFEPPLINSSNRPYTFDPPRDSANSKTSSIEEKSGELEISCNLFKSFVGIGVLSLSFAIKESGIILTNIMIIICSFLVFWSISVCIKVADHMNIKIVNFSDLCYLFTGKWGSGIAKFSVAVLQVSICAIYCSFFGMFFNNVFCYAGLHYLCDYYALDLLLCLVFIIPLSLLKNLTTYNRFSLVANLFVITVLLIIFAKSCLLIHLNGIQGTHLFVIEKFPYCFGIAIFAVECIGVVFEMRDSMHEPKHFEPILIKNFLLATALYTIMPTIFYLAFGDQVQELIIFNISIENPLGMVMQILYAIALCISYPLQLFPVFIIIEAAIISKKNLLLEKANNGNKKLWNKIKIYSSRLCVVCLIVIISWVIPGIAVFVNLVGAFGSAALGMLFPVLIGEIYLHNNKNYKNYPLYSRIINWISLGVGVIGGGFAISFTIMKIAKES